jgi:metal-dependent amidase/aminoacylase/carboxypeptidase family protein
MPSEPHKPYLGHLESVFARIEQRAAEAEPIVSPHPGAPAALREAVTERLEGIASELIALARDIHARPELGFAEHHAVGVLAKLLERHGHAAEVGLWGLPTALRARAGSGRPRIALLAEYDALPGIGHACGHNVIGAAAAGAFLAVAAVAGELEGSVELLRPPPEEGGGRNELIAREGG